ncbi:MAG: chloramphenicol-sensitive protein RarD, partial [Candidatus Azotimanducaceae bacterium]
FALSYRCRTDTGSAGSGSNLTVFEQRSVQGAYFALSAYTFWGLAPVFFKLLDHVSAPEILIQRVIWSVILLLGILTYTGQLKELQIEKRKIAILFISASLLSVNWLIFIYAIINNNIVETSLGYFINPLVSVLLGMIFLGERLRGIQWIAIVITASGIAFQLLIFDDVPWLALALAFSFGFYGLIRKNLQLHPVAGLTLETLMVLPFALAGLIWLNQTGSMEFLAVNLSTDLLLIASGFVTSFPLLCFAAAVTRLSLTAAGMFQYIAPSISLVIAVVIFNEPFGLDRQITFGCIWIALILFSIESLHFHRQLSRRLLPTAN